MCDRPAEAIRNCRTSCMDGDNICRAEQGSAVLQVFAGVGRVHQRAGQSQKEGPGVCALPQLQAHSPAQGWPLWQVSLPICLLHICQLPSAICHLPSTCLPSAHLHICHLPLPSAICLPHVSLLHICHLPSAFCHLPSAFRTSAFCTSALCTSAWLCTSELHICHTSTSPHVATTSSHSLPQNLAVCSA